MSAQPSITHLTGPRFRLRVEALAEAFIALDA